MFTLLTLNVTNVINMSIKLNTKETNITVYDEANLDHATGKEIIPLLTFIKGDFKTQLISIIAKSLNMSDTEEELYKGICTIYNYRQGISIKELIGIVSMYTFKSVVTYKRAIETLINKGVIVRDLRKGCNNDIINVNHQYHVNGVYDTAKYIVVKIDKKD